MSIKTEMAALVADLQGLRPHVRDTGEPKYFAIVHQATGLAERVADDLTPPTEPTDAMQAAGVTAMANLPPDTTAAGVVDAVLRAALLTVQGA
ncbi:hypothetical protein K6V92_00425 [Cupriavidus respiraculi]|uniref:hypothetical protein n=1 Tax=Cupriavidus respiraculi TaxID=195930 RepID=UPI001C97C076|nr:hypothetical protein [Cupriavidus respiraculi]MBY4945089.1 hypothetical protein [Cupriavidus respiraculi]